MKVKKFFAAIAIFFVSNTYGYYENDNAETNDYVLPAPCCPKYIPVTGLYLGANLAYSWFDFTLHRPQTVFELFPLSNGDVKVSGLTGGFDIGYDFFPRTHSPVRVEYSFEYGDKKLSFSPLFPAFLDSAAFANDNFRLYNHLLTLYIDWHNCSPLIPFIGASAGWSELVTTHLPNSINNPNPLITFKGSESNISWGGTIGTRIRFNCHFYGRLQYRFTDLKDIHFKNFAVLDDPLPNDDDYLSDYFHENSIIIGLDYVF